MNPVSLVLSPKAAAEQTPGITNPGERPLYPYGTKITLNDETLTALGIPMPQVGEIFTLMARVEVVSARADKAQDGDKEIGVDLQITDMTLSPQVEAALAAVAGARQANKLWPDKPSTASVKKDPAVAGLHADRIGANEV